MSKPTKNTFPRCPLPGYAVRPARESDVDFIFGLDRLHMKPETDKCYPGDWDDDLARSFLVENLARARVVELDGAGVASYYWWIDEPATAFLHSVQIAEQHRRKGLGCWLMECFESEAKAHGLKKAALTVFDSNPARDLYLHLGYVERARDGDYAAEMEKSL